MPYVDGYVLPGAVSIPSPPEGERDRVRGA
jgi:hypothetical protein